MKLKLKDIEQILDKEIEWCRDYPNKTRSRQYRTGFIGGLIQAKYLIKTFSEIEDLLK